MNSRTSNSRASNSRTSLNLHFVRRAFSATVAGKPVMNSSRVSWALVLFVSLALGACRSAEPQPEPAPDAAKPAVLGPAPGPGPLVAKRDEAPQSQGQGPGFPEQT